MPGARVGPPRSSSAGRGKFGISNFISMGKTQGQNLSFKTSSRNFNIKAGSMHKTVSDQRVTSDGDYTEAEDRLFIFPPQRFIRSDLELGILMSG